MFSASLRLNNITQPAHAALAARIMQQWQVDRFRESASADVAGAGLGV
jgi:hypothetical protein